MKGGLGHWAGVQRGGQIVETRVFGRGAPTGEAYLARLTAGQLWEIWSVSLHIGHDGTHDARHAGVAPKSAYHSRRCWEGGRLVAASSKESAGDEGSAFGSGFDTRGRCVSTLRRAKQWTSAKGRNLTDSTHGTHASIGALYLFSSHP